ncbi:tryptophan synthase subunit alpha [Bacillus coahuilensis m2-6]|uniref:tryptophan synthase subunit alpha n=1 Tax=Bacillus coahuilensis TaxID=408580 RepID=UPI0007500E17|nr:tryptophan synthase subunit alpha [Bacillus coahuilensis]KUP08154.1 tryptophan synthase subunit alpha [Bacillus coahuilensis m2-6]
MNKLTNYFIKVKESGRKGFVPYIMAGDGGIHTLKEKLNLLESLGATAIEVGVPFSDPVADGPSIQEAGERSRNEGTTIQSILHELETISPSISVPIILMSYLNPIYSLGILEFAKTARKANVKGVIIPDLSFEESVPFKQILNQQEIGLIQLLSLTSSSNRAKSIIQSSDGFIYVVTVKGITGARKEILQSVESLLSEVNEISPVPVYAGFGISKRQQVTRFQDLCDGAIVGSKIVDCFHQGQINEIKELMGVNFPENV